MERQKQSLITPGCWDGGAPNTEESLQFVCLFYVLVEVGKPMLKVQKYASWNWSEHLFNWQERPLGKIGWKSTSSPMVLNC